MKKLSLATILILAGCSSPPMKPGVLGFDGSVVRLGIANINEQFNHDEAKRRSALTPTAVAFCKEKGFQTAIYQQEVWTPTYFGDGSYQGSTFLCK